MKPGRGAGYHSSDSYRSYQVAEGSIGPAQSVDSFIRDGQSTFVITGDTLGYNGIAVPPWDDSATCAMATLGASVCHTI